MKTLAFRNGRKRYLCAGCGEWMREKRPQAVLKPLTPADLIELEGLEPVECSICHESI